VSDIFRTADNAVCGVGQRANRLKALQGACPISRATDG